MSDRTGIEWTDATWNPLRGCTRVSEGCRNCYAEHVAARFSCPGQPYEGLAQRTDKGPRWTGKVALVEDVLDQPLRWRRSRRIFVNSMSDLFHESVPDEWIDRIFAVMALAPQHQFQVLTKRPARMRAYLEQDRAINGAPWDRWTELAFSLGFNVRGLRGSGGLVERPLPNVWLGTSIEDQPTADARIPHLLATPAAVRFVSAEPLLGPVDGMYPYLSPAWTEDDPAWPKLGDIDWLIVGGESGPGARPMHPDWARSLRDQCAAAGVPFFFKQWGEWAPAGTSTNSAPWRWMSPDGTLIEGGPDEVRQSGCAKPVSIIERVGKRAAGRLLDGRTHDAMPGDAG